MGTPARRLVVVATARMLAVVALLVAAYYLLPFDVPEGSGVALLVVGLLVVLGLTGWLLSVIRRSPHPAARGLQTLAIVIPLFLLVFSTTYFVLARDLPGSVNVPLTRTDALYFTTTVFATVGFGDIVAVDQTARLVVTVQMIGDLLVLGVLLRVVLATVRHTRDTRNPGE